MPDTDREKKILQWLHNEIPHTINGSRTLFETTFKNKVRDIMYRNASIPESLTTLEQYIYSKSWGRGSATDTEPIEEIKNNKKCKTRRSKASAAYQLNASVIRSYLTTVTPQSLRVFQKLETGQKTRDVVCGDFANYLKMDFLNELISKVMSEATWTPLFNKDPLKMWDTILQNARDPEIVKLPLDQSNFDYQPTRQMIASCLDIVIEICNTFGTSEHVLVAKMLKDSMLSPDSKILLGDKSIQYIKGIASGWRWTALLDTIINIAEFEIVCELVEKRIGRPLNIRCAIFQGDDVQSALKEQEYVAQMILETYKELNFNVNAAKTIIEEIEMNFSD